MTTGFNLKIIGAILKYTAEFMEKKPIVIDIPAETSIVDLTEYSLGTVQVVEANGKVTVTKLT